MIKKLLIAFVMALTSIPLLQGDVANAYYTGGDPSQCNYDYYNAQRPAGRDFVADLRAKYSDITTNSSIIIYQIHQADGNYNSDTFRWIAFTNSTSKFDFAQDSTGKYFTAPANSYSGTIPSYFNTSEANEPLQWNRNLNSSPITASSTYGQLKCISQVKNVTYSQTWQSNYYPGSAVSNQTPGTNAETCTTTDILCHMRNISSTIGDGFSQLANAIVTGIAYIFMPNPDYWQYMIDELTTRFNDSDSALMYPLQFINGTMQATIDGVNSDDPACTYSFSMGSVGGRSTSQFFGSTPSLSFCSFYTFGSGVQAFIRQMLQIMITVSLIWGVWYRYNRIVERETLTGRKP